MATQNNNSHNASYTWTPPGTGTSQSVGSSTWTTSSGVWGTGPYDASPKIKKWTKITCHKCGKEIGYMKDSYAWARSTYYCDDCKLLEKLKE